MRQLNMDIVISWMNYLTWLRFDRTTQILTLAAVALVGGGVLYIRRKEAKA